MKYTNLLLYIVCVLTTQTTFSQHKLTRKHHAHHHYLNTNKEFKLEKIFTVSKITIIQGILLATLYFNKKKLMENIEKNPILSCIGSCFIINFLTDSIIRYKQINRILSLFKLCKTVGRYILYAIAIKNTMQQFNKRHPDYTFQEDEYFQSITSQIPLSFSELEQFTFELLYNSIKTMNTLHIKTQSDVEANMYMLSKEHLTLEEIIEFYSDDRELYPDLKIFLQNPIKYYDSITTKLNNLIKIHINQMIKQQRNQ